MSCELNSSIPSGVWPAWLFVAQALIKQDNLDAFNEKDPYKADDSREDEDDSDDNDNSIEAESFPLERDEVMPPPIPHPSSERVSFPKGLPWAPKVRYCSVRPDNNAAFVMTFEAGEWLQYVPVCCLTWWKCAHMHTNLVLTFKYYHLKSFVVVFSHREKDIENFLESSRSKFIGYTLGR